MFPSETLLLYCILFKDIRRRMDVKMNERYEGKLKGRGIYKERKRREIYRRK